LAIHRQLDIAVYLMGGRNLVDGRLYQVALSQPPHLPFTYPPFAALVFAPLSWLPQRWAQVIWALINVVALFALVALALRAARPGLGRQRLVMWSLVLMAPAYWVEPVHLTFSFGQVNILLAAMVLGDLTGRLSVGNWTLPRGVLVGIAASIKLVPLVFVPYLFLTRQTRAAWVSLGTFIVCSAVTAATDPRVSWSYWTKYAFDAKRVGGVFYISNQSLRAVADRLDHRVVSTGLITLASAAVVVAGVLLAAWAYRSSSSYVGILVCATTGLLASPITWAHHMVWVVPVLIWLVLAPDRPTSSTSTDGSCSRGTRSSWPPWCSWSASRSCCGSASASTPRALRHHPVSNRTSLGCSQPPELQRTRAEGVRGRGVGLHQPVAATDGRPGVDAGSQLDGG
jgi:alpha-1,2-mannosyltransferase